MHETHYSLSPIGFLRSPLTDRGAAPRQGREGAPDAWLEVDAAVAQGLEGIEAGDELIVITWLHQAERDTLKTHPRNDQTRPQTGVFATRSPDRPNPLGLHRVTVREIVGNRVKVGPIEAIDGTPVVDLKPVLSRQQTPKWSSVRKEEHRRKRMSEHPMETTLRSALWRQFGAAIDMLENALLACPSTLWTGLLWSDPEAPAYPTFWSLTHHTLFWLDLYLTGSLEGFAPPTPFTQDEFGPSRVLPEQPYPKEELHAYLVQLRQKCQITLLSLSDEQAQREVAFPWRWWKPMSFFELQLYTLRHVQEHAAQLSLFLGQHGIPGEALDWVARAKEEPGN